ncbi:MAG: MFS transporter, partial [Firmicutes bacterium]|nr:MFS transporter [Bacillota bacterium]
MNSLTQYRGLPRQVYYVAFTRLIMEMGIMFVFPLMSLLLTEQLGFSTIETGYLMTTVAVISLLGSLFGGKLADQFGRRRSFFALSVISISSTVLAGIFCHERTMIPFITVAFMTVNAL